LLVEDPEIGLSSCISLICGKPIEARGLAVVLWEAATAGLIEDPKIDLPGCVPLVCGKLELGADSRSFINLRC
jgi:hypothetical protein